MAHFALNRMLASILLLDLLIHADYVFFALLPLVLFHELFEHLLGRLLTLLSDVFLDELVYAEQLLLPADSFLEAF